MIEDRDSPFFYLLSSARFILASITSAIIRINVG
jgi:hypothetical protein